METQEKLAFRSMTRMIPFFRFRLRGSARRGENATTAVEMALIAPIFFLLLIGTTELCLIEAGQQLLENATFNAARLITTGYVASGQNQQQTVTQVLNNELQSYGNFFNTAELTITAIAYNSLTNDQNHTGGTNGFGNPQQIVDYSVSYPWQLQTPLMGKIIGHQDANGNWVVTLTSHIVLRDEPY
jgi:Flp pilus assembly protein TadG